MKPGDLVRIHPKRSHDQYGDLEVYNLFNPGVDRKIIGAFSANEVGIFLSKSGTEVKVIVKGVIGLIHAQSIQVVE